MIFPSAHTYDAQQRILLDLERSLTERLRRRDGLAVEREPDEGDALQATIDSEAALSDLNRANQLRRRVRAALARMADGSYGECEACGEPIASSRLAAVPWASRCLPCEEEREEASVPRSAAVFRRLSSIDDAWAR